MTRTNLAANLAGRLGLVGLATMLAAGLAGLALADGPGPRPAKKNPVVEKAEQKAVEQRYGQTGEITLANGALRLNVPATYYFLPAPEARAHLQRIGAPAPAGEVLGMVAPSGARPIDDGFWGAVISANPLGYVAEERADRFAAADFIEEVRAARPAPAPRIEAFASPPVHDATRHLTAWTERTAGPATARTVRNEQRLLGRNIVAGVTIDARADQLASVAAAAPEVGRMVSFPAGQAYGDYRAGADPSPLYDLPSLITLKTRPTAAPAAAAAPAGGPAAGIPAQSSGLQPVGGATDAPASAFSMADVQRWLPWIGGGLVALAVIPWLVSLTRRRGGERVVRRRGGERVVEADPNLTPKEE
ncbi:MAG: DUF2167 domain-containing protein [Hyphomonadaceae bacterium]|nr:DUF2167 domain-containing protein [Hyphomonadaceae bacterium]